MLAAQQRMPSTRVPAGKALLKACSACPSAIASVRYACCKHLCP